MAKKFLTEESLNAIKQYTDTKFEATQPKLQAGGGIAISGSSIRVFPAPDGGLDYDNEWRLYVNFNGYSKTTETGNKIELALDSEYKLTATLYDKDDNLISTSTDINIPIEGTVVDITINSEGTMLYFQLKNGHVAEVPLGAIIKGLASETWVDNNYLSLEGGEDYVMKHAIMSKSNIVLSKNVSTGYLGITGGNNIDQGAEFWLYGKNYDDTDDAGCFKIEAYSSAGSSILKGCPNSELTWGGKYVVVENPTAQNYVTRTSLWNSRTQKVSTKTIFGQVTFHSSDLPSSGSFGKWGSAEIYTTNSADSGFVIYYVNDGIYYYIVNSGSIGAWKHLASSDEVGTSLEAYRTSADQDTIDNGIKSLITTLTNNLNSEIQNRADGDDALETSKQDKLVVGKATEINGTNKVDVIVDSETIIVNTDNELQVNTLTDDEVCEVLFDSYSIICDTDGNGTLTASKQIATAGETITLTATPNLNYAFDRYEVISPSSLVISSTGEFTMPDEDVEIKAYFEVVPTGTYYKADTGNNTLYLYGLPKTGYTEYVGGTGIATQEVAESCTNIVFESKCLLPRNCSYMFYGYNYISSIDTSKFIADNVTNTTAMFHNCSNLTSLDLTNWNTTNLVRTNYMFYYDLALEHIYAGSNWTVANVTESEYMFIGCYRLHNYDSNYTDKTKAIIDDGTNGGYLESKA